MLLKKQPGQIEIIPEQAKGMVLLIHGFGGCKEEMLPLASYLGENGYRCTLPDLPGHGDGNEEFTFYNAIRFQETIAECLEKKMSVIGYSLGGALSMETGKAIAISPPFKPFFEDKKSKFLELLRPQQVKGKEPWKVLKEIIGKFIPGRWTGTVVIGDHDIPAVKEGKAYESGELKMEIMIHAFHQNIHLLSQTWNTVLRSLETE